MGIDILTSDVEMLYLAGIGIFGSCTISIDEEKGLQGLFNLPKQKVRGPHNEPSFRGYGRGKEADLFLLHKVGLESTDRASC